jgi:transposase
MFHAGGREVNGMAYSMEFRVAVAKAYDECLSSAEVAEQFGCSASWVRRLIQRRRLTDSLAPLPQRRADTRRLREPDLARLGDLVRRAPDLTLAELAAALGAGAKASAKASVSTVWRATRKLGLTLKKSRRTRPSRTGRTSRRSGTTGSSSSPA